MRTLFTIHAGEFLVAQAIKDQKGPLFRGCKLWIPIKDEGIDLLVTDSECKKRVSIQVKFSNDFRHNVNKGFKGKKIVSASWFTFNYAKMQKSAADKWVLVCYDSMRENMQYVIIDPQVLSAHYKKLNRVKSGKINSYFWVNDKKECWETRDLNQAEKRLVCEGAFKDQKFNFTKFLNRWEDLFR